MARQSRAYRPPASGFQFHGEQLPTPAIRLAALVSLNQNDRSDDHDRRTHKTEWLQRKTAPVKQVKISQAHCNRRQYDD